MASKQSHWLNFAGWGAIALSLLSLVIALFTQMNSPALVLVIVTLSLGIIANTLYQIRTRRSLSKHLSETIKQLKRQLSEVYNAIPAETTASDFGDTPPLTFSNQSSSALNDHLQTQIEGLEQSLDTVVQYLREQSIPERLVKLEQTSQQLRLEIQELSRTLTIPSQETVSASVIPKTTAASEAQTTTGLPTPSPSKKGITWQQKDSLFEHSGVVASLAISPDGRWLASVSWDKTLKIWDLNSGNLKDSLTAHQQEILAVTFLDSDYLVTGSFDQEIKLWSLHPQETPQSPLKLQEVFSAHTGSVQAIATIPNRPQFVSGSYDQTLKIWDWKQGIVNGSAYDSHGAIYAIAVSAEGTFVASGGADGRVIVWDLAEYQILYELAGNVSSVTALAISVDQKQIVVGCADGSLKSWELSFPKKRPRQIIAAHRGKINALLFTQDGEYLLTGGTDGEIKCWEPNQEQPCSILSVKENSESAPTPITSLVMGYDNRTLFAGDMNGGILMLVLTRQNKSPT